MKNLLNLNFWFNVSPGSYSGITFKIILGAALLLVIVGIAFRVYKSRRQGVYGSLLVKLSNFSFVFSLLILVFLFLNYEIIPILSSRFWFPLIVVIMGVWLIFILKNIKRIKAKKAETIKQSELKKYLP